MEKQESELTIHGDGGLGHAVSRDSRNELRSALGDLETRVKRLDSELSALQGAVKTFMRRINNYTSEEIKN
jgi:septal ring factor EnvC (AmiA/AmiB activator)